MTDHRLDRLDNDDPAAVAVAKCVALVEAHWLCGYNPRELRKRFALLAEMRKLAEKEIAMRIEIWKLVVVLVI